MARVQGPLGCIHPREAGAERIVGAPWAWRGGRGRPCESNDWRGPEDLLRFNAGDFLVQHGVDDEEPIDSVIAVGHCREVYRWLKRR